MNHFSTHYSIQVALLPTFLGKLKIEHKNTFHTLFWHCTATSRRGCLSWNKWMLLLFRAEQNNAGRDVNPRVCCHLKQKYTCFLLIHCALETPFPTSYVPLSLSCPLSFAELCSVSFLHNSIHPGVISVMRRCNILASEITDYEKNSSEDEVFWKPHTKKRGEFIMWN